MGVKINEGETQVHENVQDTYSRRFEICMSS
jgi:hypothetical protein